MKVQLQPHDHIWEISSMETHDVFGDPGRSKTTRRGEAKRRFSAERRKMTVNKEQANIQGPLKV